MPAGRSMSSNRTMTAHTKRLFGHDITRGTLNIKSLIAGKTLQPQPRDVLMTACTPPWLDTYTARPAYPSQTDTPQNSLSRHLSLTVIADNTISICCKHLRLHKRPHECPVLHRQALKQAFLHEHARALAHTHIHNRMQAQIPTQL